MLMLMLMKVTVLEQQLVAIKVINKNVLTVTSDVMREVNQVSITA